MGHETDAANRYRHYAEELRTIADDHGNQENIRQMLVKIAKDYEEMARMLDAIKRSKH